MSRMLAPIRYEFSPEETARFSHLPETYPQPKNSRWMLLMVFVSSIVNIVIIDKLRSHDRYADPIFTGSLLALSVVTLVLILWQLSNFRKIRFPRSGELLVGSDGLKGTLDGRAVEIPWRKVYSIVNAEDAIVIRRREIDPHPIVVPKRAIENVDALWNLFDEKLTAKRGLVRTQNARTLYNTARA
jgi:hypothetical protein